MFLLTQLYASTYVLNGLMNINAPTERLSLVELAKELSHIGHHLFMHLHACKMPAMLSFCGNISLDPGLRSSH